MAEAPLSVFSSASHLRELAARGLGKVDALGIRGATGVSVEEIIAMAAMLAVYGLEAIPPGTPATHNEEKT